MRVGWKRLIAAAACWNNAAHDRRGRTRSQIADDGSDPWRGYQAGNAGQAFPASTWTALPAPCRGTPRQAGSRLPAPWCRCVRSRLLLASASGLQVRNHALEQREILENEIQGECHQGSQGNGKSSECRLASLRDLGMRVEGGIIGEKACLASTCNSTWSKTLDSVAAMTQFRENQVLGGFLKTSFLCHSRNSGLGKYVSLCGIMSPAP